MSNPEAVRPELARARNKAALLALPGSAAGTPPVVCRMRSTTVDNLADCTSAAPETACCCNAFEPKG